MGRRVIVAVGLALVDARMGGRPRLLGVLGAAANNPSSNSLNLESPSMRPPESYDADDGDDSDSEDDLLKISQ